jgi:hypothetical protein
LGLEFIRSEVLEWGFFVSAILFAAVAAVLGHRVHKRIGITAGFGLGIVVLTAGRLGEAMSLFEGGAVLAVAGGSLIVLGHFNNSRASRACSDACCPG